MRSDNDLAIFSIIEKRLVQPTNLPKYLPHPFDIQMILSAYIPTTNNLFNRKTIMDVFHSDISVMYQSAIDWLYFF